MDAGYPEGELIRKPNIAVLLNPLELKVAFDSTKSNCHSFVTIG